MNTSVHIFIFRRRKLVIKFICQGVMWPYLAQVNHKWSLSLLQYFISICTDVNFWCCIIIAFVESLLLISVLFGQSQLSQINHKYALICHRPLESRCSSTFCTDSLRSHNYGCETLTWKHNIWLWDFHNVQLHIPTWSKCYLCS